MHPALAFRSDGTFTIAQFTDLHWHNGEPGDLQTQALMEQVLDAERPDLVLLTGDNLAGSGCLDPARGWQELAAPMETRGIAWAAVFGNHDDEGLMTRREQMEVMRCFPHCLSEPGPEELSGVGNWVLQITPHHGGAPALLLYCLDSNSYAETDIGGWGWIRRDQIAWYLETSAELARRYGRLPALAFFHIPLPEYDEVWDHHVCYGSKYEPVCCPKINTGFFAALHEAGEVMGCFVGHDHINDFDGELYGIRLCYGRGSGYQTYGKEGFPLGARLIRCRQGERAFESWLRLEGGEMVVRQPRHEPCGRVVL